MLYLCSGLPSIYAAVFLFRVAAKNTKAKVPSSSLELFLGTLSESFEQRKTLEGEISLDGRSKGDGISNVAMSINQPNFNINFSIYRDEKSLRS